MIYLLPLHHLKTLIIVCVSMLIPSELKAQTIHYSYDAAGNRIKREIVLAPEDSLTRQSEVKKAMTANYSDMLSGRNLRIYPNPTEGILKVDFSGCTDAEQCHVKLFNMSGQQLFFTDSPSSIETINLISQPKGIYLLSIIINGEESTWRIIKK